MVEQTILTNHTANLTIVPYKHAIKRKGDFRYEEQQF